MGRKKNEEDGGKLSRYVNTPEAMAVFRHLYEIPNNVGLRYVHWFDALPSLLRGASYPRGGGCGRGDSRRRTPRKNLIKINSLRQVWESELYTDEHAQPRSAPKLLRYTARTHSYLACRLVPNLEAALANPENKALPPIDIRDVLDTEAPDMSGINLRNRLPTRREEGTTGNVPASSQPAQKEESEDGKLSRAKSTVNIYAAQPAQGEGSVPLWAPRMEYRGEDAVTEADCILPINETRSGSVASALSQVVRLPLDMDEWKKATDDGLINNLRRGLLMGVQASWELEERFRTNKDHLAHANVLALKYQDAKKMAADAKKMAEAADAKRVEAEESLNAALDSLTKAEDKIRDSRCLTLVPGFLLLLRSFFATPLEVPMTPIPEISADVVNLEDEVNSAEAAAPDDAAQAPGVPDGGGAVPDEAGPSV
uniref:Uncharacterized protein n=1 Tax=Fagus sylvatica TaxID=28930 RepID=A0A2N9IRC8_FAGSY